MEFDTWRSLSSAVREGRLERVRELISSFDLSCSQVWSEGYDFLFEAIISQHTEVTKLLLRSGFKVNRNSRNQTNTLLHYAVINGDIEIVEMLLEKDANINAINQNGRTPLHIASIKGHEEIFEILLKFNAHIDSRDKKGRTVLHYASRDGHEEIVEILLKFNAHHIDSRDECGTTALHFASEKGRVGIVEILLKFYADIDSRDEYDRTALHFAVIDGHKEIVEILLKFDADIDSRDKNGRTALHLAAKKGYLEIVEILLKFNADIDSRDKYCSTALQIAARFNYLEITEILKQQIIKMKTANLDVSRENLLSISSNDGISDFQNECEEEMGSMKSEKIGNNNVSFHDILTKNISQLAIYARNENIVQVLKSDDYKTKFPIYAGIINSRFRKGVIRKELLEQGNRFFHSLFNRLPELPYNCTEKIFSYLSDKDLRFLIETSL